MGIWDGDLGHVKCVKFNTNFPIVYMCYIIFMLCYFMLQVN